MNLYVKCYTFSNAAAMTFTYAAARILCGDQPNYASFSGFMCAAAACYANGLQQMYRSPAIQGYRGL